MALVIARKAKEVVRIGDNVTLIVNWVSGRVVSLAFEAPKDLRIVRGELEPKPEAERAA